MGRGPCAHSPVPELSQTPSLATTRSPGNAGARPSTLPALTLGHREQPGAPLAEEVVALHLRHRDPGGRAVPHGRGPLCPRSIHLLLLDFAPDCLPGASWLFTFSSPCNHGVTQQRPAPPHPAYGLTHGPARQSHLAAGQSRGHLHASAGALRSAQPCQSEDAGLARPITPRASGGCACPRRHIQGPSILQMSAKAGFSGPVRAKGFPPRRPLRSRHLPHHTRRTLQPCPAQHGDWGDGSSPAVQGPGGRAPRPKQQAPSEARLLTGAQAKPPGHGARGGRKLTQTQTPDPPKNGPRHLTPPQTHTPDPHKQTRTPDLRPTHLTPHNTDPHA